MNREEARRFFTLGYRKDYMEGCPSRQILLEYYRSAMHLDELVC